MPAKKSTPVEAPNPVFARYNMLINDANKRLAELREIPDLTLSQSILRRERVFWDIIADFVRDTPTELSDYEVEWSIGGIRLLMKNFCNQVNFIYDLLKEDAKLFGGDK